MAAIAPRARPAAPARWPAHALRYWGYARRPLLELVTRRSSLPLNWVRSWVYAYILVAFWRAVYGHASQEAGFTVEQIVSYVVAGQVLNNLLVSTAQQRLEDGVRQGTVILDLLKPVRLPFAMLADAAGAAVGYFASQGLPMLLFGLVVFRIRLDAAPAVLGLVFLLALLGFLLLQLLDGLVAYAAFWTVRTAGLDRLVNWLVFSLLGGSFVPYAFFPRWAQGVLIWSPLSGLYSSPVQVWVGRMSLGAGFVAAGRDLIWLGVLGALLAWVHARAMRRVLSFGG
jgi:ABC-2 type transport system permease protein